MRTLDFILRIAQVLTPIILAWIAFVQKKQAGDIQTLEKNTNSMKDALVALTAESSRAQGNLEGHAEEKAKQAKKA